MLALLHVDKSFDEAPFGAGPGPLKPVRSMQARVCMIAKYSLHWVLRPGSIKGVEVVKPNGGR